MPSLYFNDNGTLVLSGALQLPPDSRALRYGDGFFETMKMINGNLVLEALHLQRLFASLQILQFDKPAYFTPAYILEQVALLTAKNKHRELARVRLMIMRGAGTLYEVDKDTPYFIIQSWGLQEFPDYDTAGATIGVYSDARKSADAFSHLKSNNYLPYAMAARWSKANKLDDALVLNSFGHIAEATTSNVFVVKDSVVQTPPLSEGCIDGVVRTHLLQYMRGQNIAHEEKPLTPEDIEQADELFLTNAGFYIRPVAQCGTKKYGHAFSKSLFHNAIVPLLAHK